MTNNSLQSTQFNPYFQYIKKDNKSALKNFLKTAKTNSSNKVGLNPFLPNFYLRTTNSDQVITNFFKILFHIKDYLHKMDQCIQIIKLNQQDLKSVSVNLHNLNFSENILGFNLDKNNSSKDQKNLQTYLNSMNTSNNKNKSTNNISLDFFSSTKNVFTKIQKPLALAFIENNYIQNNHYRNYYIQLLNNSNNALTALLQKNNVVSIYAFRPLLEIQACLHKKTIKKNNKINKNGMKNNSINYKIVGNNNTNNGESSNSSKKNKKNLINKIPEYSQLYDTYNYQTLLQTYSDESNQYFQEFYKHMSNIYHQKVGDNTLYDYVMAALQLEKNFLLFLVSNIDKDQISHLYHLDNVIKGDIHRNIDTFLKFHPALDLSASNIPPSSTPSSTPFSIPSFENFLETSITGDFTTT